MVADRRIEAFVLIVVIAAVVAFGVSTVVGVRRPAGSGGAAVYGEGAVAVDGESPIRVEVLNGAGRAGLAERVTARLRTGGFDVVYFGNASSFDWERSLVYARSADTVRARAVADALGIDSVEARPEPELHLDATVVLGRAWTLPPSAPRSRLRGWLKRVGAWFTRDAATPGDDGVGSR